MNPAELLMTSLATQFKLTVAVRQVAPLRHQVSLFRILWVLLHQIKDTAHY